MNFNIQTIQEIVEGDEDSILSRYIDPQDQ
jgi:hypothetical protein